MAGDRPSRAWEEVRRALGRLIGRAAVRDVSAETRAVRAEVRLSEATEPLTAAPGGREDDWRLQAETLWWPLPDAQDGGAGMDLATVATVVSANRALATEAASVQCPPWRVEGGAALEWHLGSAVLPPPAVWAGEVRYAGAAVRPGLRRIALPGLYSLPVRPVVLERKKRTRGEPPWRIRAPRFGAAPGVMARVPITRTSLAPPPGMTTASAFAAERRQLAAANGVAEEDVLLVGLFPQVPLNLVQRLSVVAEGGIRLQIWLKPEALTGSRRQATLATVILGRQRSTGRVLQTVAKPPPQSGST